MEKELKNYTHDKLFSEAVVELEGMYNLANNILFASKDIKVELPVLITIQSRGKHNALGWVTSQKAWIDGKGEDFAYELNVAAESLARPAADIFNTIVHEMCHLVNIQRGVQDCTNSQRHNKKFKEICDKVGLYCEQMGRYGWAATHEPEKNSDELKAILSAYMEHGNPAALGMQRKDYAVKVTKGGSGEEGAGGENAGTSTPKKRKSNQRKYVCPKCGTSVRATKDVRIMCADCMELMIPAVKNED